MDGRFYYNHGEQQRGARHHVQDIPSDAVVGPSAGGSSFGDEYALTRSVGFFPPPQQHAVLSSFGRNGGDDLGPLVPLALAPPKFTSTNSSSLSNRPPTASAASGRSALADEALLQQLAVVGGATEAEWAAVTVPELPPAFVLEANHHVYLDAGKAQGVRGVAALLEACFRRLRVDFACTPRKCKWKAARFGGGGNGMGTRLGGGVPPPASPSLGWALGLASPSPVVPPMCHAPVSAGQGVSVDFRCRLFQAAEEGALVLEFQRRQGDYFLMRDAFEAFLAAAETAGLVLRHPDPSSCFPFGVCSSSVEVVTAESHASSSFALIKGGSSFQQRSSSRRTTAVTSTTTTMAGTTTTIMHSSSTSSSSSAFFSASATAMPPPSFGRVENTSSKPPSPSHGANSTGGLGGDTHAALLESLAPLLAMARAPCRLQQLEAAQALARLSASEDNRALLTEGGAIPALVALVDGAGDVDDKGGAMEMDGCCPELQRAVAAALSNLSESASCKHPLVEAGAVPGLLRLINASAHHAKAKASASASATSSSASWSYRALETRRESARTLANLSEEHAAAIVRNVGREAMRELIHQADGYRDERLKMHARRLKARVGVCC